MLLLSPARLDGKRGQMLFRPASMFPLAAALRSPQGAPLGDVFAFVSGLYFRGKLAYARAFRDESFVITHNRGLVPLSMPVTLPMLKSFVGTDIHHEEKAYREPLERDVRALAKGLGPAGRAVLLGSIATRKYVEPLLEVLGERLLFPKDFVGRGDMSRGSLMLRAAEAKIELPYVPVQGAMLHGARPAKLPARRSAIKN